MTTQTRLRPVVGRAQHPVMRAGRQVVHGFGAATSRWRPDPEFLVIGAKRGGSTSFYYDLLRHPQVCPLFPRPDLLPKATMTKGIHYFDQNFSRGERWYRSHLPSTFVRARQSRRVGAPVVSGEASPYYLFHPAAPGRAHALLPDARIIAVLRDPVERTYSHWKERRRSGAEDLDFVDALEAEEERVAGVTDAMLARPDFYSYAHEQQTYARQSEYDVGLERWLSHYPRDQVLVMSSEEYYLDPPRALDRAVDFLGLRPHDIASGEVKNAAAGEALPEQARRRLAARFAPHNERLRLLTGERFDWA